MKKSKENILITRLLSEDSQIWKLNTEDRKVIAQSFLDISPIEITSIPDTDVYFFYSKNAIKYFMNAAKNLGSDLSNARYATMGSGTAGALTVYNIKANFVGQGSPSEVAKQLIDRYSNHSICFVRAQRSTQSVQKLWPSKYSEIVAYKVKEKSISVKEKIHTILATSPMNLRSVMNSCDVSDLKRIVCIGQTTYDTAQQLSNVAINIAEESSEQGMLDAYMKDISLKN